MFKQRATQIIGILGAALLLLGGCASVASSGPERVDLNSMSLQKIEEKARAEGRIDSVGMPDDWANWGDTWSDIKNIYGLDHSDIDMSSAEELAMFEAEKGNATKDIGDVGQSFGPLAKEQGLSLAYKTSYWDDIPSWAKDNEGHWIISYLGTMSIITNTTLVPNAPKSFSDILEGDYMVSIGDVAKATQAQNTVLSAALAYGGSESDIMPGIEYFRKLAEQGRLDMGDPSIPRLEKGEIAVAFLWDYNALGYRDVIVSNNPNLVFEINIPSEAAIQSGYTTIINAYSKRPYAAALTREYILSDQGQINLAKGYAKPIRSSVVLPPEIAASMIDNSQYVNAQMLKDREAWEATVSGLGSLWQNEVLAYQQ